MSIVSSGLARFFPFGHYQTHQPHQTTRCGNRSSKGALTPVVTLVEANEDEPEGAEIAAVEFADAFAKFNLDSAYRNRRLVYGLDSSRMAPWPFAGAADTTIAFGEEAGASTSAAVAPAQSESAQPAPALGMGLKRIVSSLHFRGAAAGASGLSTASSPASRSSSIASSPGGEQPLASSLCWQNVACQVQANQVEMEFISLAAAPFQLSVCAPSGERERFSFGCGQTALFAPRRAGCGHGNWHFEIRVQDASNPKKTVKRTEEILYFDGVGTLYFCVDAELRLRLTSQNFLRLPSHNRCCGGGSSDGERANANAAGAKLKHSITQPTFA